MENFINFITENWRWLLATILAIVNILLVIFKRKVKVYDSVKEIILSVLPSFINIAEDLATGGEFKKQFVIDSVSNLLINKFANINVDNYNQFISDSIESILATPRKKG